MFIRKLGLLIKVSDITSITERNYYEYSDYIHAVKIIANNKGYVFRNMEIDEVIGIIEDSPPEKEYILDLKEDKKPKALEAPEKECLRYIKDIVLSIRVSNAFLRSNITCLKDITKMTKDEILSIRNIGRRSLVEIKNALAEQGLRLKDD